MEKKVIFLDIDGTLTEAGSNIPPQSALEAIRKARENGHRVFLCSGRNYDMLSPLLKYGFDGVIASSGGYILVGEKVIFDRPMTEGQKIRAMDVFERNGVFLTIECVDGSYTDERFKTFLEEHKDQKGNSELLRWRRQIEEELNIRPLAEYRGDPVYKMVLMSPDMKCLEEPMGLLGDEFSFCIQDKGEGGIINGELVSKAFDKGKGVERVCRYLNVPLSDTVAFGDSMNDLEMIETAALGICMANGSDTLKEIADEVCPAVDQDGLARAFRKHALC